MAITILDFFSAWRLTGSPAYINVSTNMNNQPNIRLDIVVLKYNWNYTFNQIYIDSLIPDNSGKCKFGLSEIFSPYNIPAFTFPDINQPFKVHPAASSVFYMEAHEYYGNPPILTDAAFVGPFPDDPAHFFFVKGHFPQWCTPYFFHLYTSYLNKSDTGNNALCLADIVSRFDNIAFERTVLKTDTQKIFIHTPIIVTGAYLKIDFVFSDLSSGTYNYYPSQNQLTALKGQVIEFHTGHNAIGIDAIIAVHFPGKTLKKYSVKPFTDPGIALNDVAFAYILDESYHPHRREFLFRTSFGGYDTLCFTGQSISENHYEYDVIKTPFWPGISDSLHRVNRTDFRAQVSFNTGILHKNTLIYLPEMLISPEVYEILNGKLMPVIFDNATVVSKQDKDGMLYAELSYTYSPKFSQQ